MATTKAPIGWGDADVQARQIERQRALAERLLQRSETPLQGQMVGGHYIAPHWTSQLAGALSGYVGDRMNDQADKRMGEVAEGRRKSLADALQTFGTTLNGTPAQTIAPMTPNDDEGNPMPSAQMPAKPGNASAAYMGLMQSGIPELQQMGMQGTMEGAKAQAAAAQRAALAAQLAQYKDPQQAIAAGIDPKLVETYFKAPLLGKEELVPVNGQLVGKLTGTPKGAPIPKQPDAFTLGDTRYGPDGKPIATYDDPNKPFGAGGKPNTMYQEWALKKAKAGAAAGPTVNVNTATKPFLNKIGEGVGEQVVSDFSGARSAQQTLNNVNQIEKALGNVIVGPGANVRVKLGQIGQILGVNGKDATEQLENTRNVVQGLARQELAAAGAMKGQGQITESERGILRRAEAGEISEFTVPEIKTLLGALKKTSSYRIGVHNSNLDRLKKDPNAAGVVDYMTLPGDNSQPNGGFKILEVK